MARKKRLQKFFKKVGKGVKNAGKKLTQAGGFALLLPFKALMVNALKRKGESVSMATKMKTLAPLFKARIIDKKTSVNYETLENLDAEQITQLAREILDFIKTVMSRKKDGIASDEDKRMLEDAEKGADEVVRSASKETETGEKGNWFAENKVIVIGVLAVVLFLAFRKK